MRKSVLSVLGLVIVATVTSAALAQDAVIFFDVRDNSAATGQNALSGTPTFPLTSPAGPNGASGFNSGRRGAGQVLRLSPVQGDSFESDPGHQGWPNLDADGNRATGKLWLYMDVVDNASLGNELVSSLGLDMDIIAPGTLSRNRIGSLAFTLDNDNKVLNSITPPAGTAGPWNNKLNGTVAPISWPNNSIAGIKAVAIPVNNGPSYDTTNRLVPNTAVAGGLHGEANVTPYRLGHLDVVAGLRTCTGQVVGHAANSVHNVFLKGNNLLTTRVTQTGTNPGDVQIAFGYNAGVLDPNISGNVIGVASASPDAVIVIQLPGDWNGSGAVSGVDTASQLAAAGAANDDDFSTFLGDENNSRSVTGTDTAAYLSSIAPEGASSCP